MLERDARDLRVALRGRHVELGPVRQLSPLLAGSLERGLNVAEAMEARGYGRPGHTRAPRPAWTRLDRLAVVGALLIVVGAWLALAQHRRLALRVRRRAPQTLNGVSLSIDDGEHIALLGPSGGGKSTLLRALAGLVPHFHGGVFAGRVTVAGLDTREATPAALVGHVASVFQDPEDQAVMSRVANEVAFGLENTGVEPSEIWPRVEEALASVGAAQLAERPVSELSAGELQRVCLASALALRPRLLLLDEPTSQLDPEAAESFFDLIERLPCAVLVSEQRPARPLARADRILFMDGGRDHAGRPA